MSQFLGVEKYRVHVGAVHRQSGTSTAREDLDWSQWRKAMNARPRIGNLSPLTRSKRTFEAFGLGFTNIAVRLPRWLQ